MFVDEATKGIFSFTCPALKTNSTLIISSVPASIRKTGILFCRKTFFTGAIVPGLMG
jgi:hypothetical protein